MVSVEEHYENVLSDVYTWLMGGFESAKQSNSEFFEKRDIHPFSSGLAVDLGAGSGFQSIPLAENGFSVTAIDLSQKLLNELKENARGLSVNTVQDDILEFQKHIKDKCELIVCMTDTITHLKTKGDALSILQGSYQSLESGGKLVLTFRDLTETLEDTDRFIPVRSNENIIFTCFLEYETETVKIHDIVYINTVDGWKLNKSCYRKLRLSSQWVETQLATIGFRLEESSLINGFQTIIAVK